MRFRRAPVIQHHDEGGANRLRPRFRIRAFAAALLLGVAGHLGSVGWVLADGTDLELIVDPRVVHAGDVIAIHTPAAWTEVEVTATLVARNGAARTLGNAVTGPDGSLEMRATIPADMPAGTFTVVVTSAAGETKSVTIVVEERVPILPILGFGAAMAVIVFVGGSMWRRRAASPPAA